MTHDYLLEATKSPTYMNSRTLEHPYLVIRALLELHTARPDDYFGYYNMDACSSCYVPYPCPTVAVIEAELNA